MNNLQKFLIFTIAFIMAIITLAVSIRNTCRMLKNTACAVIEIERKIDDLSKVQKKMNAKINASDMAVSNNEFISDFMKFLISNSVKLKAYKANGQDKNWIFEGRFIIENSSVEKFFRSLEKSRFFSRIGNLSIETDNNSIVINLKMHKDEKRFNVMSSNSNYSSLFNYKMKNNRENTGNILSDSKVENKFQKEELQTVSGTCLGKIAEEKSELFYIKLSDESVITLSSDKMSGTEKDLLIFSSGNTIYRVKK